MHGLGNLDEVVKCLVVGAGVLLLGEEKGDADVHPPDCARARRLDETMADPESVRESPRHRHELFRLLDDGPIDLGGEGRHSGPLHQLADTILNSGGSHVRLDACQTHVRKLLGWPPLKIVKLKPEFRAACARLASVEGPHKNLQLAQSLGRLLFDELR